MKISELETPVPVVELDRMARNLDRMAAYAADHGLALRPHGKTHKSPFVAAEQIRRGAKGLTCATTRELEVMGEVTTDLLLAYPPVGAPRLRRLMELPEETRLTVALDSEQAVDSLADAAHDAGRTVGVFVELDVGMHRVGLASTQQAVALARRVASCSPLEYRGLAFYPGHIRGHVSEQDGALHDLTTALGVAIDALERNGLAPPAVSGGSTPTMWRTHEIHGVTEFRPGTYVYNDRTTAQIGACDRDDCALTVLATVVSTAVEGQAVIDAGTKALGREPLRAEPGADGFGELLDRAEVTVVRMSEEHGVLDLSRTSWRPVVGEQVRVIPNHVCIVVHLNEVIHGVRGSEVVVSWPVEARGRRPVPRSR
ncbi:MAG: alanine racemase [Gemmatimonadota bacterium]|nr:alanine racemase [Gemmatimonadota bacterium]